MNQTSWGSRIVGGLFLLLLLAAAPAARATTYYVSTGGNDAGTGLSTSDPWRTFHYSCGQLAANDTLIVMPGTYDLSHEGNNSNITVSASNVTIEGQTAGTAIIDGDGATSWNSGIRVAGNDMIVKNMVFKRFNAYGINISGCSGANANARCKSASASGQRPSRSRAAPRAKYSRQSSGELSTSTS